MSTLPVSLGYIVTESIVIDENTSKTNPLL